MKISEIITDKYKLRIPPTVYYELLADVQEVEEEQKPTTKNDLVTLTFSKGTLKYSCKDYVVYKKDWLRSHYGAEIDIMFGDSQYKEPTTKNDLGVDCISRVDVLNNLANIAKVKAKSDAQKSLMGRCMFMVERMPTVTPQEPKTGHWIADVDKWGDVVTTVNGYRCDKCNAFNSDKDNYCPNCGAKMAETEADNGDD